jgi:hypothetical protein
VGESEIDAETLGEVTGILTALVSEGKRVHVSWRVRP